jgi:hypothetical protein
MSQWKNIGTVVALSIAAALAGTGCLAQSADDAQAEPENAVAAATAEESNTAADEATEKTGETSQACFGFNHVGRSFLPFVDVDPGFGCGGCGFGLGGCGLGFGGCGLGFGGCGLGFGGCGLGFGGCGLGFGGCGLGFGGCGGCF